MYKIRNILENCDSPMYIDFKRIVSSRNNSTNQRNGEFHRMKSIPQAIFYLFIATILSLSSGVDATLCFEKDKTSHLHVNDCETHNSFKENKVSESHEKECNDLHFICSESLSYTSNSKTQNEIKSPFTALLPKLVSPLTFERYPETVPTNYHTTSDLLPKTLQHRTTIVLLI